jgi:16S rRNA (guanine966-N2)-methyltransferase
MTVKILGGVARGFPLALPRSDSTRPTSVLIKRKLFDWRQDLGGYTFIDLCAGSGAMAFEALSRGAEKIVVVDTDKSAFLTIKKNRDELMRAFRFEEKNFQLSQADAKKFVEREISYFNEDTILFFDPPYEDHALYASVLATLKEKEFAGEVWVETDRLKGPPRENITQAFHSIIKVVEQGDHFVVVGKLR